MKKLPRIRGLGWGFLARPQQPRRCEHIILKRVREKAESFRRLTDHSLAEQVSQLRHDVTRESELHDVSILVPTFAAACEALRRTLGFQFYDVQLLAGLALSNGAVVEMQTGEGKTIVSVLPGCLHA